MNAAGRRWTYDPHAGGQAVPGRARPRIAERLQRVAEHEFAGHYRELDVRFRGKFCYVHLYTEPVVPDGWPPPDWDETRDEFLERLRATPLHLCRLRYHGDDDRWSFAFYSYASERYEPSVFPGGELIGAPEDAFVIAASVHLG